MINLRDDMFFVVVYLQTHSQTLRNVDAANDVNPLALPSIHQVKWRPSWNYIHIPCLQSPLSQFIFVDQPHLYFSCNQTIIIHFHKSWESNSKTTHQRELFTKKIGSPTFHNCMHNIQITKINANIHTKKKIKANN